MPKRVEAWATDDGTVFESEHAARVHEAHTRLRALWVNIEDMPPRDSEGFAEWHIEHAEALIHALRPLDTPTLDAQART